jgi:hypothetical protein
MKKLLSNAAKIYSFSEISSSFNENTDDLVGAFTSTFGSGLLSFSDPSSVIVGEKIIDGLDTFFTIRVDGNQEIKFIDNNGISKISDELVRYSIVFDELSPLNGSQSNPIEFSGSFRYIPSFNSFKSSNHSLDDILAIYVNGTPLYNSEFTIEDDNGVRKIVLNRVRFGKIFPSPKDKNGRFFKHLIENNGVSKADLNNKLKGSNGYVLLEFPFIKTRITDKELVLEVISSTNNKRYYHIPKNFPKYKNGSFYREDEYTPGLLKINLGDLESNLQSGDKVRFFFISKALKRNSSTIVKKYFVGMDNLSSETIITKEIFMLDERIGEFLKLDESVYSSLSDLVVFNFQTGEFDISSSVLPYSNSSVYFGDISYSPPLRVFRGLDYVNNISIFGHWGATWRGDIDQSKNVYVSNIPIVDSASSAYDGQSNLVTLISSYKTFPQLNDSQGTLLGTINQDGSIVFDSQVKTPFNRLRDLYLQNTIVKPIVFDFQNMVFTNDGAYSIPIMVLLQGQTLRFYGAEFVLRALNPQNGLLVAPPDISVIIDTGMSQQTIISYTSLGQISVAGNYVYKDVNFSDPISYTHNGPDPGVVYFKFNISEIILEIYLANFYAFVENV